MTKMQKEEDCYKLTTRNITFYVWNHCLQGKISLNQKYEQEAKTM